MSTSAAGAREKNVATWGRQRQRPERTPRDTGCGNVGTPLERSVGRRLDLGGPFHFPYAAMAWRLWSKQENKKTFRRAWRTVQCSAVPAEVNIWVLGT